MRYEKALLRYLLDSRKMSDRWRDLQEEEEEEEEKETHSITQSLNQCKNRTYK